MDWYQEHLVDTGLAPTIWLVLGFVVTFALTRTITARIRARSLQDGAKDDGPVKDIFIGGVHVHHQVWGILLVLGAGLLEFRYQPDSPWAEVLGAIFGIGAALALDEFALWFHLEDVYWSEQGRKSIDAVLVAAVVGIALLLGTSPLGVTEDLTQEGLAAISAVILLHIGYTIVCLLKGKIATGLIGLVLPVVGIVGAIRLAKPTSYVAMRHYGEEKMRRARARLVVQDARRERMRDRVPGVRSAG